MATEQLRGLIRQLRFTAGGDRAKPASDGQLVERFHKHQDQAAFEQLLHRHGPMVLGVCRRMLGHAQDAEDAFQATFLVLVRRAASIKPPDMVGNWLYGVACRAALKARALKRRIKEKQVDPLVNEASRVDRELWTDVQAILDEELRQVPEKYRAALLLCDLEGKPRKEAALQLKLPEGTLSSRLATGRQMLAKRLTRRGVTLTAATLATLFTHNLTSAAVPGALAASTLNAAQMMAAGSLATGAISAQVANLTQGVLKAMLLSKLKMIASVFLAVGILAGGLGWLASPDAVAQPAAGQDKKSASAPKDVQPKKEADKKEEPKKADPFLELKERLKKHEDEIAKIRLVMLKEVEDEEKKYTEAIKKAQEASKGGDRDSFFKASRLTAEKMRLNQIRFDIEVRIRVGGQKKAPAEKAKTDKEVK